MATVPATSNSPGRAQSDLLDGLSSLTVLRQLGLMIGLAASVALGGFIVVWSMGEDYQPLYASLDRMDPNDVLSVLQTNGIKHKVDEKSGALLVAADQMSDARLKLAGAGIAPDGSFGFEILDKEQPLGTSQFMENARFKRGLEGELARTVASIRSVKAARVHLAIPKASAFIRDPRKPSASVFVDLYTGSGINAEQVRAIANLVAFSIPELVVENVKVVDQNGKLLSVEEADIEVAAANRQMKYSHEVEASLLKRVNAILSPLLGADKFRAQVSADVDFTAVEQADEMFNPDLPAIRSEQSVEESRIGGGPGGVPGALSNQPPAEAQAPTNATAAAGDSAAQKAGSSRSQTVRNYELDRTVSYTRHQVGRIRRLTVAVVVDNQLQAGPDGAAPTSVPIPQEQLDRYKTLVRNAVGFDPVRGDDVEVVNASFVAADVVADMPVEELPLWQHPAIAAYGNKLLGALLVLLLVFGVLRPLMRNLADNSRGVREQEAQRALGEMAGLGGNMGDETVTLSGGDSLLLSGPDEHHEQQINAVKGLVAEDPGRVAQVVKKWIAASE